jgi:putative spermidine/putrescine transport system substrate-binding protein
LTEAPIRSGVFGSSVNRAEVGTPEGQNYVVLTICQAKASAIVLPKTEQPTEGVAGNRKRRKALTMKNSEAIINTTLTRREFLRVSGLGLAGATLLGTLGCGGGGSGGEGGGSAAEGLVFTSSGSAYQRAQTKAWLNPYSKETGTTIRQDSPTDYAKIQSMVENDKVVWDVVNVSNDFGLQSTADLLEPLDYSVIDKEPILEGYANKYRIACMLYANVLAYNTEQVKGTPTSWADFFDTQKLPGRRGLHKSPSETLEVALLGDGVSPENLYPLDVDRALGKLDTIKGQIVWWESAARSQQQIADGEVALISAWNGRMQTEINAGAPVKIQWNQNLQTADYLVVPKGTTHKDAAMKLIAYCVSGENNHRLSNFIEYAPINKESISKVDPQVAPQLPTAHRDVGLTYNAQWWDNHREAVMKRFNEWVMS